MARLCTDQFGGGGVLYPWLVPLSFCPPGRTQLCAQTLGWAGGWGLGGAAARQKGMKQVEGDSSGVGLHTGSSLSSQQLPPVCRMEPDFKALCHLAQLLLPSDPPEVLPMNPSSCLQGPSAFPG